MLMNLCDVFDILSAGVQILTNIWNVERKPVQESVADQLGEHQTKGELHHSLCETPNAMKTTQGRGYGVPKTEGIFPRVKNKTGVRSVCEAKQKKKGAMEWFSFSFAE